MNLTIEDYILEIQTQNFSKVTVKSKTYMLTQFERWMKENQEVEIEEVTKLHVKRWRKALLDEGLRPNTINTRLVAITSFYKYCVDEGLMKDNPAISIEKLKEPKVMIKAYDLDDINNMINFYNGRSFMDTRNRAILTCLFETGIRSQELSNIKMTDIFDDHILINGKGNKQRLVPISKWLKKALTIYSRRREKYLDKYWDDYNPEYLFIGTRRNGEDDRADFRNNGQLGHHAVHHIVRKAGKAVGVDVRSAVHSCRRAFAQIALGNTDLYTVSRLLGHSQVATTERYIHSMEDKTILKRGRNATPLSNFNK